MRLLTAATAVVLMLTACGDGDGGATTTTTSEPSTTTSTVATTPSTTTTAPPIVGDVQVDPYESAEYPGTGSPGYLTEVRTEAYDEFTRIVFEFDAVVPEFKLRYTEAPVVASPSGEPVDIAGDQFLLISLAPASGVDLSGDEPVKTYTGPDRFGIDGAGVHEMVKTEDWESHMTWAVGIEEAVPFSFTTLEQPARVVVDIHTVDIAALHVASDPGEV